MREGARLLVPSWEVEVLYAVRQVLEWVWMPRHFCETASPGLPFHEMFIPRKTESKGWVTDNTRSSFFNELLMKK